MEYYHSKYTTYLISEENFEINKNYTEFPNIIFNIKENNEKEGESELLNQIMSSVGITFGQNAVLINLGPDQEIPLRLWMGSPVTHVLALGLHPQQLQLQGFSELHTIYQFNNLRILFGLPLDQYKAHKNNKSLLWNALRSWKNQAG
ncbi:MAG: hypothetical protein K1X68_11440 [Saprospiraceae bacterium]|nr:hypothetical protein [Saprospiraceae bacterium]HMW39197.1 hypothetical protein [Saprospiraceae bacterium]HMX89190.1 hypothetical protein [Saprospiraceae bacterium]HMZ40599.1 hypothetical protein [Saprospiraceae bacterium]HNA65759.1 hypothetical protein [Saprospiraceae bacterium]